MRTKGLHPNNPKVPSPFLIHVFVRFLMPFLIPVFVFGLNYALLGIYPFGQKTILIADLSGQYVDFYAAFQTILTEGKSLFYSWEAGMGLNFIGLFAYYLASPFSLLIIFFPKEKLPEALALMTLLKFGAAGVSFAVYAGTIAKELQARTANGLTIGIFASFYALSAYPVVYSFNLMWLDGIIFLPLVLLAVEHLLKNKGFFGLHLALVLTFIANFYLSYMVGLFSFLYFLVRYFSLPFRRTMREFFHTLGLFLGSALLAAGSAAFLLIPAYFALQNGPENQISLSLLYSFKTNFPLLDLVSKLPLGGYDSLSNDGLPNLYSGLLPLLLLPLFFLHQGQSPLYSLWKEKILNAFLLITLILSFYFSNLNLVWHAFDTPNSFPYRYSFLFSFLTIALALRAFLKLNDSDTGPKLRLIWLVYSFWVIVLLLLRIREYPYLPPELLNLSLLFLTVYAGLLHLLTRAGGKKNLLLLTLLGVTVLETSINTGYLLNQLDQTYRYVTQESYRERLHPLESLVAKVPNRESFFRMERTVGRSYNDPLNANYPGMTHFSSLANFSLHQFLGQLGFSTSPNRMWVNYAGATPVTDSLLGIAYIISPLAKAPANKSLSSTTALSNTTAFSGYPERSRYLNYALFENPWALPLAFLVDRSLLDLDLTSDNPFDLQNAILNLALGIEEGSPNLVNSFTPLAVREIKTKNLRVSQVGDNQQYKRIDPAQEASLEFLITSPKDQQVFAFLAADPSKALVYVNDTYLGPYFDIYNQKILNLGFPFRGKETAGKETINEKAADGKKTAAATIKFVLQADSLTLKHYYFYGFNESPFNEGIAKLRRGVLKNLQVDDTRVTGTIDVEEKTLLYTSIPYDPGWEGFVDGQKTPLVKIAKALIGMELPPGNHKITLKFTPQGFRSGFIISVLSLISVFTLFILSKVSRKKLL